MRFGQKAAAARLAGWRYVDYDLLKSLIKTGIELSAFRMMLNNEVLLADECFQSRRAELGVTQEVRAHAVLNYLTILKICKKAAKALHINQEIFDLPGLMAQASFCRSLRDPLLLVKKLPSRDDSEDWSCPICLQHDTAPMQLKCSHSFCAPCLSECAHAGMASCPLCRESQTLDPIGATIEEILSPQEARNYQPALRLSPSVAQSTNAPEPDRPATPHKVLTLMTFNIAAICFPLHANPALVLLGVMLFQDWSKTGLTHSAMCH